MVILTSHRNRCDKLFISSDLRKWTTIHLQYFNMSLTVYQSKSVLVGGCSSSTHEPTNIVLTSTTGEKWEPSLPPMPTKRYDTTSVSTRSPEVLVVAGGVGVGSHLLDVVEVFKNDQWTTANPLPAPCCMVHSTFHDGSLYFIGGTYQPATMYTCSCASLISSCEKASSHTSNSQLWRWLRAPGSTAIISHSSRLISIDYHGRVECYSSTHNSWIEATSEGNTPRNYYSLIAACVLPTGDIVYANAFDGIYRVTVSGMCVCICVYIHASSNNMYLNVIARLHAWGGGRRGGKQEECGTIHLSYSLLEQISTADGVSGILVVCTNEGKRNVTNSTCHYVIYVQVIGKQTTSHTKSF